MKKTFTEAVKETLDNTNPALSFITPSTPTPLQEVKPVEDKKEKKLTLTQAEAEVIAKAKRKLERGETKSVRLNLLITPSNKEAMDMLAQYDNTSINEILGRAIKAYADNRADDIKKIKAIRGE